MNKLIKRVIATLLCLAVTLLITACNSGDDSQKTSSTAAGKTEEKERFKYFSTDIWQQIPLVTKEARDMGYEGGEGCQWMTYITFDQIEGKTAYAGIDVGGILKSTDGGKTWAPSGLGMKSFGATGITVDPTNVKRVIAIGADSTPRPNNGLYLSTDEGHSWQAKCLMAVSGERDFRRQVAFDESSYDKSAGYCKVIYWVTEDVKDITKGIYKSTDGGETWFFIKDSAKYAGSCIAVHPKTGDVYLTNKNGLLKSTDGGKTFKNAGITEQCNYLCTIRTQPDKIYITGAEHFFIYDTKSGAATKQCKIGDGSSYPQYATHISVSPSDPNKMVLQSDQMSLAKPSAYIVANMYSHDGGKTWHESSISSAGAFIPNNPRQNPYAFHPKDSNIVLKLGGDFIMRSTDGGKSYHMSNDGNNAICTGGGFNFNVNNNDLVCIASQDYNGGFSTDGGKTWTYVNWAEAEWGGFTYGAYILNETTMVVGLASAWYSGEVEIVVTRDGGKTIECTGIKTTGSTIGCGALGNDDIAFFADHRTTDGGKTWTKMNGCTGVFCVDKKDGKLFGLDKFTVVMSTDNGETWERLTAIGSTEVDMAYNPDTDTLYCVGNTPSFAYKVGERKLVYTKFDVPSLCSIAIDQNNTKIMYGTHRNSDDASSDSVYRSIDGGKTWHTLNISAKDETRDSLDGGRVCRFVRVNDKGEAWFVAECRGLWKMVRPNLDEKR